MCFYTETMLQWAQIQMSFILTNMFSGNAKRFISSSFFFFFFYMGTDLTLIYFTFITWLIAIDVKICLNCLLVCGHTTYNICYPNVTFLNSEYNNAQFGLSISISSPPVCALMLTDSSTIHKVTNTKTPTVVPVMMQSWGIKTYMTSSTKWLDLQSFFLLNSMTLTNTAAVQSKLIGS